MNRSPTVWWPSQLWPRLAQFSNNTNLIFLAPFEVRVDVATELYLRVPTPTIDVLINRRRGDLLTALRTAYNFDFTEQQVNRALKSGSLDIVVLVQASGRSFPARAMDYAARSGNIELINYLYHYSFRPTNTTIEQAAKYGHLPLIQHLYLLGVHATERALSRAAIGGHLVTLKWLLAPEGGGLDARGLQYINHRAVITNGHLEVLRFLYDQLNIVPNPEDYDLAYAHGHQAIIDELRNRGVNRIEFKFITLDRAARVGNLAAVKELLAAGIRGDDSIAGAAATHGHLDVLKVLIQHGLSPSDYSINQAIANGHYEVVRFLYQHVRRITGGPTTAVRHGHFDILDLLMSMGEPIMANDLVWVAWHGSLSYIKTLLARLSMETNPPAELVSGAVQSGQVVLLRYLLEELQLPITHPDIINTAAEFGYYQTVSYLFDRGLTGEYRGLNHAIQGGHVGIVRLYRSHGHNINDIESESVGHVEMAKYIRQLFCGELQWPVSQYVRTNNLSVLAYLADLGLLNVRSPTRTIDDAISHNHLTMSEFLYEAGFRPNRRVSERQVELHRFLADKELVDRPDDEYDSDDYY